MQRPDESLPHADRIRALERARRERGVAQAVPATDDGERPGARSRPAGPLPAALAAHVRATADDEGATTDDADAPDDRGARDDAHAPDDRGARDDGAGAVEDAAGS